MSRTRRWLLYGVGGLLMAIPGLFNREAPFWFFAFMLGGFALLVIPTVKFHFGDPLTAIVVLGVTNLSFWLSVVLWRLRPVLVGPPPPEGIDPVAAADALWLLAFLPLIVYESIVFIRGIAIGRQRSLAAVGLLGVVAQIGITVRTVYLWIMGI